MLMFDPYFLFQFEPLQFPSQGLSRPPQENSNLSAGSTEKDEDGSHVCLTFNINVYQHSCWVSEIILKKWKCNEI